MLREIKTKEQKQRGNGRKAAIAPLFFLPNRPEAVTVGCQACEKRSGGPFLSMVRTGLFNININYDTLLYHKNML